MKYMSRVLFWAVICFIAFFAFSDDLMPADTSSIEDCGDVSCEWPQSTNDLVLSQDNWKLSVPDTGWLNNDPPQPGFKVLLTNDEQHALLILIKDQLPNDETFAQFVVDTIKIDEASDVLVNAVKQVRIHDTKFIMVQGNRKGDTVWSWLTVKDGFGYTLLCGGEIDVDAGSSMHDMCQSIASTLEIK